MTVAVLTFARHAQNGRVHWSRVSGAISYSHDAVDPAENLATLAAAKVIGQALASFNPQHPGYQALKAKLAEAYGQKPDARSCAFRGRAQARQGQARQRKS